MISDCKLWVCTQQMLKQQEDRAPVFVAGRIGALAVEGDEAGVETWKAIARRLDGFRSPAAPI